ncbi:hypothetical protein DWQ65_08120 [Treponema phagedenis]|nr:hypothetical protein DWQ65_08120 [Treponema phagedenis]
MKRRHQCKNDVLKQNSLQSFKTRRFGFDKEVKMKPLCQALSLKLCMMGLHLEDSFPLWYTCSIYR